MSPLLHYAVWVILIARLLMPITVDSGWRAIQIPYSNVLAQQSGQAKTTDDKPSFTQPPSASVDQLSVGAPAASDEQTPVLATHPEPQPAVKPQHIFSWSEMLVAVWISGVCVCLVFMLAAYYMLRRRIAQDGHSATTRLTQLLEECKQEMGINANLYILSCYGLTTPALLAPRTILMPMESLVSMDEEQVLFSLRHELMHYKRRDHLVSVLLSVLQAVYWFNPFVWLAFRQMRLDMEVACDNAVVKQMSSREKSGYAMLILSLFTRKTCQRVLGLAQGNAKRIAEKRIRGIYMDEKSRPAVKAISFVVAGVLLVACFTTACQPVMATPAPTSSSTGVFAQATPSTTPLEAAAPKQSAAPVVKYEAPASWKETIQMPDSKLKVSADAVVTLPDVQTYPIYKAAEAPFTQEQINNLIKYFVGDKQVIKAPVMTKADFQRDIDNTSDKENIKDLKRQMASAPVTNQEVPITNFSLAEEKATEAWIKLGDGKYGKLQFTARYFMFCNGDYTDRIISQKEAAAATYKITPEQAQAAAMKVLDEIGASSMGVNSCEKAYLFPITDYKYNAGNFSGKPESKGYYLTYVKTAGGINDYLFTVGHSIDSPSYTPPWDEEQINLYIDEDGNIQSLSWFNPLKLSEEVTSNTSLAPFEDIKGSILGQLTARLASFKGNSVTATIDRIDLKMSLIDDKKDPDGAMFAPAWYVQYTIQKIGDQQIDDREFMLVNAIDGGSISMVSKYLMDQMNQAPAPSAVPSEASQEAQQMAVPSIEPTTAARASASE